MHFNLGGLIFVGGGVFSLLVAYGVVRASKDPAANEAWLRRFGPMMKVLSPIIILFGLAELFGLIG